jgi:outer membrane receptor protein involved in Fe transport
MQKVLLFLAAGLALFGGWPETVKAQETQGELAILLFEQMPVTVAAKKEENILKTPSTVSIIDQYLIEKYNFQTIAEAVQTVAGMDITRTTFMSTIPMARGVWQAHYANKVLIMIDNVPSYNAITGEGFLNRIGINDVERIEVLKGPASVLYGSNAYAGAINIVLKSAKTEGLTSETYGSFGDKRYFSAGGNVQYKEGDLSLATFANSSDQEGTLTTFTDNAGVRGQFYDRRYPSGGNGSATVKYQDHGFLFSGYKDTFSVMEGSDPLFASGAGRVQERDGYLFNYDYKHDWGLADLNLSASYDWNYRLYIRTLDDLARTTVDGYRLAGVADANIKLFDPFVLELGYNYDYRVARWSNTFRFPTYAITDDMHLTGWNVHENSYIAQFKYEVERWNVVVGARATDDDLFGWDISPRATVVFLLDKNDSLKLIAGKSFRVPSLFELYVRNSNRTLSGNTALNPETAKSLELAYLLSYQKLFCQLQVYRALYEGFIGRETLASYQFPDESAPRTNVRFYYNGPNLNGWGSELELSYRDPELISGFFTATYEASDDPGDDLNFKYIPNITLNLGLTKDVGAFFASANGIYRSSSVGFTGQPIYASGEVNLNLGYKAAGGKFVHMVSVKNAADTDTLAPSVNNTNLNAIPTGTRREVFYTFKVHF